MTATTSPLVWQNYGTGNKYHREDCRYRRVGVAWRRSFAAAEAPHGLALEPCKACRPEVDPDV